MLCDGAAERSPRTGAFVAMDILAQTGEILPSRENSNELSSAPERIRIALSKGPECRFGVVGTASPRSWYRCSVYPVLQGVFFHS